MHFAMKRDFEKNRRTALMLLAVALWIEALTMAAFARSYGQSGSDQVPMKSSRSLMRHK